MASRRPQLVAVVTMLAGQVLLILAAPSVVAREAAGPGVPSTVYGVAGDGGLRLEKDLAVGTASVALANRSDVFVVTAADGAYHRVRLPGYDAALHDAGAPGIALSPDGTRLAYAWHARDAAGPDLTASGARVVDLVSGQLRTGPARGDVGVGRLVWNLSWSPDGRYLVYATAGSDSRVARLDWFPPTEHGFELVDTTTYRVAGAGPGSQDTDGRPASLVVTSDGTVLRNGNGETLVSRADGRDHRRIATFGWRSARVTPSGAWVALASAGGGLVLQSVDRPFVGSVVALLPRSRDEDRGSMDLLGWTARNRLLALVRRQAGPSDLAADGDLVQLTLSTSIEENWAADFPRVPRARMVVVGRVTGAERGTVVSVATDLAAADPPTRELDPPPFVSGVEQPPPTQPPESARPAAGRTPADEEPTVPLRAVLVTVTVVALAAAALLTRAARRRVPGG